MPCLPSRIKNGHLKMYARLLQTYNGSVEDFYIVIFLYTMGFTQPSCNYFFHI